MKNEPPIEHPPRKRWVYFVMVGALILIGLPARLTDWYPDFVEQYAGDALWAMMLTLLMAAFPRLAAWKVWAITLIGCYAIEISQLYQAEWINQIRRLPGMGLVLGYGFLWTDLVAYTIGTGAGFVLDLAIQRVTGVTE